MNVIYQHLTNDRKDEEIDFDELSQLRTTMEKTEEGRINFQNKRALVPKTNNIRKEEGATVDFLSSAILFPYLSSAGCFVRLLGRTGSVLQRTPNIGKES
jgi:hypothetical protein